MISMILASYPLLYTNHCQTAQSTSLLPSNDSQLTHSDAKHHCPSAANIFPVRTQVLSPLFANIIMAPQLHRAGGQPVHLGAGDQCGIPVEPPWPN